MARTITLRIDGEDIPAQVFYQKLGAELDALRGIERSVTEDRSEPPPASVKWVVESIRAESPVVMTLRPEPATEDAQETVGEEVVTVFTAGLKEIQSHAPLYQLPPYFTMPVLEAVRALARPFSEDVTGVTIITPEETVPLSAQANANLSIRWQVPAGATRPDKEAPHRPRLRANIPAGT